MEIEWITRRNVESKEEGCFQIDVSCYRVVTWKSRPPHKPSPFANTHFVIPNPPAPAGYLAKKTKPFLL